MLASAFFADRLLVSCCQACSSRIAILSAYSSHSRNNRFFLLNILWAPPDEWFDFWYFFFEDEFLLCHYRGYLFCVVIVLAFRVSHAFTSQPLNCRSKLLSLCVRLFICWKVTSCMYWVSLCIGYHLKHNSALDSFYTRRLWVTSGCGNNAATGFLKGFFFWTTVSCTRQPPMPVASDLKTHNPYIKSIFPSLLPWPR